MGTLIDWRLISNIINKHYSRGTSAVGIIGIKEKTSQLESKKAENAKLITEFNSVFSEYEQIISKVKGATQNELKNSFDAIIKEEYDKLLFGDKEFDQTIIDNAILFDIEVKVMLLKIKRDKMISYTKRGGKEVEEEITSEQTYHLLHFTEFGTKYYWGDNEQKIVKKLILECKTEEAKRGINFLSSEPYTIVTDNKNLAQHYINKIVHYRTYVEVEEEKPYFPITTKQLKDIFPDTDTLRIAEVVKAINKYSNEFGLTTKDRMAHFLAQIGTETAGLEKLTESYNYSAMGIFKTFLKVRRDKTGSSKKTHKYCDLINNYDCGNLSTCIGNNQGSKHCTADPDYNFPKKKNGTPDYDKWIEDNNSVKTSYVNSSSLFDYVYSCRLGNGAKSTNDGSTFKGVGFVHLTGKGTYKKVSEAWNTEYPNDLKEFHGADIDLLKNNIDIALKASLVYWKMKKINSMIDGGNNDLLEVTAKINLGYYNPKVTTNTVNGYKQRETYYEKAKDTL